MRVDDRAEAYTKRLGLGLVRLPEPVSINNSKPTLDDLSLLVGHPARPVAFRAMNKVVRATLLWGCFFHHGYADEPVTSCIEEAQWPQAGQAVEQILSLALQKEEETGLLHVEAYLGSPPLSQHLVVDTGSRWTTVQCFDTRRRRRQRFYDPLKSSTSKKIATSTTADAIKESYEDGSYWVGYEVDEDILLMDSHSTPHETTVIIRTVVRLACQTSASQQFRDESLATGILGLEYSTMSLPSLLRAQGTIKDHTFSVCVGKRQGLLTFGGAAVDRHQQPMMFAPISVGPRTGFYVVMVQSVWLGTVCLVSHDVNPEILVQFNNGRGTVVDSGSSDTYFPIDMEPVLNRAWETLSLATKHVVGEPGVISYEDFASFPNIRIILENGLTLLLSPHQYTTGFENFPRPTGESRPIPQRAIVDSKIHCTENSGAVLGINAFVDRDILFDPERQMIGMATADCD
jgi:Xylanase inhibitor N-terminal